MSTRRDQVGQRAASAAIAARTQRHLVRLAELGTGARGSVPWNFAHARVLTLGNPLARTVIRPYLRVSRPDERDELLHVARIGLWWATENYLGQYERLGQLPPPVPEASPATGHDTDVEDDGPASPWPYSTLAFKHATRRVHQYLDSTWDAHVPRELRRLAIQTRVAIDTLVQAHQRMPRVRDLAGFLGVTENEVERALRALPARHASALDLVRDTGPEGGRSTENTIDDGIERIAVRAVLDAYVSASSDSRIGPILEGRLRGRSSAEVAQELGVSDTTVKNLYNEAIRRLTELYLHYGDSPAPRRATTPEQARFDRWRGRRFGRPPGPATPGP